jgi:tRNA (mo5U34)-methyltransferase
VPNKACVEAMLRSAGFVIEQNPEPEVYLCRADNTQLPFPSVAERSGP